MIEARLDHAVPLASDEVATGDGRDIAHHAASVRRRPALVEPLPRPDPPQRPHRHPELVRPAATDVPAEEDEGPAPGVDRPDVRAQWRDLVRIPQHPRRVMNVRRLAEVVKRTTDFFGHRRGAWGDWLVRLNPYPRPFRLVEIPSFDGTRIRGWLALQPNPRPGVVIVPGMFSSKDDTVHKRRAIRIWRRWHYNVLIIELRGFGQSGDAPNTPGWKEAEDVLAASRFLHEFNSVTRIGVIAESLGATAALLAAAQEGAWEAAIAAGETPVGLEDPEGTPLRPSTPDAARLRPDDSDWPLVGAAPAAVRLTAEETANAGAARAARADGTETAPTPTPTPPPTVALPVLSGQARFTTERVIDSLVAFSPFSEPREAVQHISTLPPRKDPFYHVQRLFQRLLHLHTRGSHRDFLEYMTESAHHYGVTEEELYRRSRVLNVAHHLVCPTIVIHAEDDPTVSVLHSHRFHEATRELDNVVTWILPWGSHAEFDLLDRTWYWRVVGRFLGRWVGR